MKVLKGIGILIASLVIASCQSDKKPTKATGVTTLSAPYELLVVADKDWLQTDEGEVLMDLLKSDVPGLPQAEPSFRVLSVNPSGFIRQFKAFANIVMVKTGKKYRQPSIVLTKDVYAHPQNVMTISAPNGREVAELVRTNSRQILDTFIESELDRETRYLHKTYSAQVKKQAEKQFGYTIYAPKDIKSIKTGDNFFWASSQERDNMLNICMYSYQPADTADVFSLENFLVHRNEMMGKNVKGEREDQYMSTQIMGLEGEVVLRDDAYVLQVRGLWEMENQAMGGPFVSYTQIDSTENRVIVAEGFVFAPQKKKRDLIRELEASVRSAKKIKN